VVAENLISGERRHTNSCYVTMVAVDEKLKPVAVKPLVINEANKTALRRQAEAKMRREARIQMSQARAKHKQNPHVQSKTTYYWQTPQPHETINPPAYRVDCVISVDWFGR